MSTPTGRAHRREGTGLRARLADRPPRAEHLDGGWWPRSRDLGFELGSLLDHWSGERRVRRVVCSPADWEPLPTHVSRHGRRTDVCATGSDAHLLLLELDDATTLRLLVVPPDLTEQQGTEALFAATLSSPVSATSALLRTVREPLDVDPEDQWTDRGDTWWVAADGPPSYREDDGTGGAGNEGG